MQDNKGMLNNFVDRFKKLNKNTKIVVLGGATICVVAITAGFLYKGSSNDAVLFTNLSASDASQVTTKLDELKTNYKIKENSDGTITIMVDEKDTANARMEVSATFEPSSGVIGYELLDNTSFGETQADREQKTIRALEGEITKTLQSLPIIDKARVHINIAKNSFLSTSKEESTASVTLTLAANQTISKNQTIGIIKMISNATAGLTPQNVEVMDSNANLLSQGLFNEDETSFDNSDEFIKIEKEKENIAKEKVQRLLDRVVGSGNSTVEVDMDLNFDKKEIAEKILGDKVAVSEKEISKETKISEDGEIAGADSNAEQEDYVSNDTDPNNNGSSETYNENQTNYEISTRNEKTIVAAGSINKMTVSVVVNESAIADENGTVDQKLKDELLANIRTAAGVNDERNDEVSLTVTKFNDDAAQQEAALLKQENRNAMMAKGLSLIVILASFGGLLFLVKKAFDTFKVLTTEDENGDDSEAILSRDIDAEMITSNEDSMLIEERINKTIDTNTQDAVKAIRFMLSADEQHK